jgi:hypothetical protein
LANGVGATLEDSTLCTCRSGCISPKTVVQNRLSVSAIDAADGSGHQSAQATFDSFMVAPSMGHFYNQKHQGIRY